MNNYLLNGHILQCRVIPPEEVHPKLWIGANRKFRPIPKGRAERLKHNAVSVVALWNSCFLLFLTDTLHYSPKRKSRRKVSRSDLLSEKKASVIAYASSALITTLMDIARRQLLYQLLTRRKPLKTLKS